MARKTTVLLAIHITDQLRHGPVSWFRGPCLIYWKSKWLDLLFTTSRPTTSNNIGRLFYVYRPSNYNELQWILTQTVGVKKGVSFVSWIFLTYLHVFNSFQKAFCYTESINHVYRHFCHFIYFTSIKRRLFSPEGGSFNNKCLTVRIRPRANIYPQQS